MTTGLKAWLLRSVGLFGLSVVIVASLSQPSLAVFGRPPYTGYFSNILDGHGACPYSQMGAGNCLAPNDGVNFVLPPWDGTPETLGHDALPCAVINSVPSLVNLLKAYNVPNDPRKFASSAYIVQTMLGRDGNAANANGGRFISAADWADLTNRLNAANIDWGCGTTATGSVRVYSLYIPAGNLGDTAIDASSGAQSGVAIVIRDRSGNVVYTLFRACANPDGASPGLPQADQLLGAALAVGPGFPVGNPLIAGQSYNLLAALDNIAGQGASDVVFLEVPTDTSKVSNIFVSGANGPWGWAQGWNGGGCSPGYPTIACVGPHWFWGYNGVAPRASAGWQLLTFQVRSDAPNNSSVCFTAYASNRVRALEGTPGEPGNYAASPPLCFQIANPRYPYITAIGDIHAGGAVGQVNVVCSAPSNPGQTVQGQTGPGSFKSTTQYVISAGAGIDHFGSGAPAPGVLNGSPNALSFGNSPGGATSSVGQYGAICRPDLKAAALAYASSNPGKVTGVPPGQETRYNLDNGYFRNGPVDQIVMHTGDLTINGGTVGVRSTIYVDGNVYINGPISVNGGLVSRATLPTFGVIATGNIYIDPGVTQLWGFYDSGADPTRFISSRFATCANGAGVTQPPAVCVNLLTLTGFVMANSFSFGRSGSPLTFGPQLTEQANFAGALYLAPPPGFADYVISSGSNTEAPPLY